MNRKAKRGSSDAARKSDSGTQVPPSGDERTLIDKFGYRHSERVLTTWTAAVLKAMGVQSINGSGEGKTA